MSEKTGSMQSNADGEGPGVLIRPMTGEDVPAAAQIDADAFGENGWSERSISAEIERDDTLVYAAVSGGILAGYAGIRMVLDEGYVGNIVVAPRFRHRGIGRALVERLIEAGREMNLSFITLEARVSNEGAIALYEKMGFRDAGVRRGFYSFPKEDARLMTLYLH